MQRSTRDPMDREEKVQWINTSRNNKELENRYDQWSKDYDSDLDDGFGWLGPQRTVECFASYVPRDARILDAGAGTGLAGKILNEYGYKNIVALDMSPSMLKEARKKNVYRAFHHMVLGESLEFPSNSFDAVISVDVLTVGHVTAGSFDELIRITKPGGYIIFNLQPDVYRNGGFKKKQDELVAKGSWELIEEGKEFQPLPNGQPEIKHQVWVYQITSS